MNLNRPDMTETVKFENYTNKSLQKDSNPTTMEVVTQTNAVKSPTDSPETMKLVYTVEARTSAPSAGACFLRRSA